MILFHTFRLTKRRCVFYILLIDNCALIGRGYHSGIALEITCDIFFFLYGHFRTSLVKLSLRNLELDFIFGNVDGYNIAVLNLSDSTAGGSLGRYMTY